jgi:hypothetical protein
LNRWRAAGSHVVDSKPKHYDAADEQRSPKKDGGQFTKNFFQLMTAVLSLIFDNPDTVAHSTT